VAETKAATLAVEVAMEEVVVVSFLLLQNSQVDDRLSLFPQKSMAVLDSLHSTIDQEHSILTIRQRILRWWGWLRRRRAAARWWPLAISACRVRYSL
jgi:hypothetical protein